MDRSLLIEIARSKIGTPWQHNQKADGVGYDCLRFWEIIGTEAGIEFETLPEHYGWWGSMQQTLKYCKHNFQEINKKDTLPGDLLIFNWNGFPHLGMADLIQYKDGYSSIDKLALIHCSRIHGKVVRHALNGHIKKRWEKTFQLKIFDG